MPYSNGRSITTRKQHSRNKRKYAKKSLAFPRALGGGYRVGAARAIVQQPNLKPSSVTVQFTGKLRYMTTAVPAANAKSFLDIPANFLGAVYAHGTCSWVPEQYSGPQYITSFQDYFDKYQQYAVVSSQCTVSAEQKNLGGGGQEHMFQALGRANISTSIPISTPVCDIEKRFGYECSIIGGIQTPLKVGFNKCGYQPTLQHGVRDVADSDELQCINTWDAPPEKPTYFSYVVSGLLDSEPQGHQILMVTVNTSYVCRFTEPNNNNVP